MGSGKTYTICLTLHDMQNPSYEMSNMCATASKTDFQQNTFFVKVGFALINELSSILLLNSVPAALRRPQQKQILDVQNMLYLRSQ
jgi:hypothetical protein